MSTARTRGKKHRRSQQQNLDNVPPHKRLRMTVPKLDSPRYTHHQQDVIGESESDDDDNDNDMLSPNDDDDTQSSNESNSDHDKENDLNTNSSNSNRYRYQPRPPYDPQLAKLRKQQKIAATQFKVVLKSKQARTQRELVKAKVSFTVYSDAECVKQAFLKLIQAANMPPDLDLYNLKFDNFPTSKSMPDLVIDWNLDRPDIEWDGKWLTFYLTQIQCTQTCSIQHYRQRGFERRIPKADDAMERAFGSDAKNVAATLKSEWKRIKANHVIHSKTVLRKATTNDTVVDVLQYGQELLSKFEQKVEEQKLEQHTVEQREQPTSKKLQFEERIMNKLDSIDERVDALETRKSQQSNSNSIDPFSLIVGLQMNQSNNLDINKLSKLLHGESVEWDPQTEEKEQDKK